jgi:hypothetical protein
MRRRTLMPFMCFLILSAEIYILSPFFSLIAAQIDAFLSGAEVNKNPRKAL